MSVATELALTNDLPPAVLTVVACGTTCMTGIIEKVARLKVASERVEDLLRTHDMTPQEISAHHERTPAKMIRIILAICLFLSAYFLIAGSLLLHVSPPLAIMSFIFAFPLMSAIPSGLDHLKRKEDEEKKKDL